MRDGIRNARLQTSKVAFHEFILSNSEVRGRDAAALSTKRLSDSLKSNQQANSFDRDVVLRHDCLCYPCTITVYQAITKSCILILQTYAQVFCTFDPFNAQPGYLRDMQNGAEFKNAMHLENLMTINLSRKLTCTKRNCSLFF